MKREGPHKAIGHKKSQAGTKQASNFFFITWWVENIDGGDVSLCTILSLLSFVRLFFMAIVNIKDITMVGLLKTKICSYTLKGARII